MIEWLGKGFGLLGLGGALMSAMVWMVPRNVWRGCFAVRSGLRNQVSVSALLFFSGLFLGGLAVFLLNAGEFTKGAGSMRWTEVDAVVAQSEVVEVNQIRSTSRAYRVEVEYLYGHEGRDYRGGRLSFSKTSTVDRAAVEEEVASRFHEGAVIRVRVNPKDPKESVVLPGTDAMHGAYAVVALTLMGVGGHSLRMLWRDWDGSGVKRVTLPRRGGGGP